MVHKLTVKRKRSLRRTKRRSNGGGYTTGPGFVSPGNLKYIEYTGIGKDCTGNPESIRTGYIADYTAKGLPGFNGGKRRKMRGRRRGGANVGPVTNPNLLPVAGSLTGKPSWMPDTMGVGGTVGKPDVVMSMPGVPPPGMAQMPKVALDSAASSANLSAQKGGRYGFFPGMGPLNPSNGVGVSPAPFGRIPCEIGTFNPLNPNPNDIQRLSTAPLTPPFVSGRLAGGGLPAGTTLSASSANFPTVQVGQADSMRYYAPTAGYRNDFMTFRAPSPVPGLTVPIQYPARAFNDACIKTGGSRKNRNRRGGAQMPVAFDAGKFSPVAMSEIWTRKDFDGSDKLLPVKFGGKRRTRRRLHSHRKSYKK
jgi:hypothetical protein